MAVRTTPGGLQVAGTPAPAAFANGVAGGWIGKVSTSTPQSTGGAEATLSGLVLTVTVNPSRTIWIVGFVPTGGFGTGSADERTIIRIKEGATELEQDAVIARSSGGTNIQGVAKPMALSGVGAFPTPASGLHTYALTIEGLTPTSTNTPVTTAPTAARPCWLGVFDMGPA